MSLVDVIVKIRLALQEAVLTRRFLRSPSAESLRLLATFSVEHGRPFPLHRGAVWSSLVAIQTWEMPTKHRDRFLSQVQGYLFRDVPNSRREEWQAWVRWCRQAGSPIDTLDPAAARALKEAAAAGRFLGMPKEDYEYLLGRYQQCYARILEEAEPGERRELLPVLLEYAGITQFLGPTDSAVELLRRWAQSPERPRALTSLSDESAFQAPVRGVGSPNGVSLTIYTDQETGNPVRISCAGSTGDETLNAQIFTALFAAALACENEPTFVMSGGSTITLDSKGRRDSLSRPGSLLSAVIGPGGPVEPVQGAPTLGMDPEDALLLVTETFQRFQESTGLVKVMRWDPADPEQLETRVRSALEAEDGRSRLIRSDPHHGEPAGVVHAMPLLRRNAAGKAVPVEIEVPYRLLGPRRVFELLHTTRGIYMQRLIESGYLRKALAEKAFEDQDELVKKWKSYDKARKEAICQSQPWVTITHSYDFELGLIIPLDTPEQVGRLEYEGEQRPRIRDQAKEYAERFAALVHKLEELNREGGRADILSFKLLVDSMLRQAVLPVPHPELQTEYGKWVRIASAPIWALIEDWAQGQGFSPRTLAADNVVFNPRIEAERGTMVLEPWILVALHDFVIYVDARQGTMEVMPAGQTPRLTDVLVPGPDLGITDLHSLHRQFCDWAAGTFGLEAREREEDAVKSKILSDTKIQAALLVDQAKRLLFRGETAAAQEMLRPAQASDLAVVYFWAAVARQAHFLATSQPNRLSNIKKEKRNEMLLNLALNTLLQSLRVSIAKEQLGGLLSSVRDQLFGDILKETQVDRGAKDLLRQLQARDPSFVATLLAEQPDIPELERRSLDLTPEQGERLQAAVLALSSLECLNAAETLKNTARDLPFRGAMTTAVKKKVGAVVRRASSMAYQDSPIAKQLEDLNIFS